MLNTQQTNQHASKLAVGQGLRIKRKSNMHKTK